MLEFVSIFELLTKTHIQNGDAPKVGVIFEREQYSHAKIFAAPIFLGTDCF